MASNKELLRDCIDKINMENDYTWEELLRKYNLPYSENELSSRAYGMKMAQDILKDNTDNSDKDKLIKIKEERFILNDLKTSVNAKLRTIARIEEFKELLSIENNKKVSYVHKNILNNCEYGNIANLLITDLHYDGSQTPINNFNKIIDTTIQKIQRHEIKTLNVLFGGDMINNEIKTVVRIENREAVSKQLINVSKLIAQGLLKLSEYIETVNYALVIGNHERSVEDYKKAMVTDTYLPIIDIIVSDKVSEKSNIFKIQNFEKDNKIDDRFCVLNIDGKHHVVTHGYEISNIEKNAIPQLEGYLGIKIDYLYLGHFHNMKSFTHFNSYVLVNGSCGGYSDYAKSKLYDSKKIQKLAIICNGDIECEYNIVL